RAGLRRAGESEHKCGGDEQSIHRRPRLRGSNHFIITTPCVAMPFGPFHPNKPVIQPAVAVSFAHGPVILRPLAAITMLRSRTFTTPSRVRSALGFQLGEAGVLFSARLITRRSLVRSLLLLLELTRRPPSG